MSCDWGGCDEIATGWRFWPGAGARFHPSGDGWAVPPWRPVCSRHLPRRPGDWDLAT